MSQSVQNSFRDSRENVVPYYSQNIRLKIIHYTCCLNLSSVGKHLKNAATYAASLGTKENQIFFIYICYYFKRYVKKHRDSIAHIERTVNVLGEDPTKITITNASIDKKK